MSEKKVYIQSPDEVLSDLTTTKKGLTSSEAEARLAKYGKNELDAGEKKTLLMKFLEQFKDLMIIILIAAAVLSKPCCSAPRKARRRPLPPDRSRCCAYPCR